LYTFEFTLKVFSLRQLLFGVVHCRWTRC